MVCMIGVEMRPSMVDYHTTLSELQVHGHMQVYDACLDACKFCSPIPFAETGSEGFNDLRLINFLQNLATL